MVYSREHHIKHIRYAECLTGNIAEATALFKGYISIYRERKRFALPDTSSLKVSVRTPLSKVWPKHKYTILNIPKFLPRKI